MVWFMVDVVDIKLPKILMDEIERDSPLPWKQYIHGNGLVQVGDKNNKEVGIFLIIKVGLALGESLSPSAETEQV